MKITLCILAVLIASFIFGYNVDSKPKPAPTPEQKQEQWNKRNKTNGEGITLWIDTKRGIVCYVLDRMGSNSRASGISCLPKDQVIGIK